MKPETKKSFEGATAVTPIDPEVDVAQIATPGHVNAARLSAFFTKGLTVVVAVLFVVCCGRLYYLANDGFFGSYKMPPAFLAEALTYDPQSYFDIGGGIHGGHKIAWLSDYAPTTAGLSMEDHEKLLQAVLQDLRFFGHEAAEWTTTPDLETAPQITRPERVFSEHSDRLIDGVVALPENDPGVAVIAAHVEGQWSVIEIDSSRCITFLGYGPKVCDDQRKTISSGLVIDTLKPVEPEPEEDGDNAENTDGEG